MNEKQQQLTFEKGITNVPSDAVCSDNTLQVCEGMIHDNGEFRPVQIPVSCMTLPENHRLLFVHKTNNSTNYIAQTGENALVWGLDVNGVFEEKGTLMTGLSATPKLEGIGNALVAQIGDTIYYIRYDGTAYKAPASELPVPKIRFNLINQHIEQTSFNGNGSVPDQFPAPEIVFDKYNQINELATPHIWFLTNPDTFRNGLYGAYAEGKKKQHEAKRFVNPFAVRFALELYDGSLIYQSTPILMFPSLMFNHQFFSMGGTTCYLDVQGYELGAVLDEAYPEGWDDIVKGIKVFVSREVEIHDLTDTWTGEIGLIGSTNNLSNDDVVFDSVPDSYRENYLERGQNGELIRNLRYYVMVSRWVKPDGTQESVGTNYKRAAEIDYQELLDYHFDYEGIGNMRWHTFKMRDTKDVLKDLAESSIFYDLCTIQLRDERYNTFTPLSQLFTSQRLVALEGYPTMEHDDFYSFANTAADYMAAYNNRLILAGLKRTVFEGFTQFTGHHEPDSEYSVYFIVTLIIDGKEVKVKKLAEHYSEIPGTFFYYPDPRAKKVEFYRKDGAHFWRFGPYQLTVHPGLNGAYYMGEVETLKTNFWDGQNGKVSQDYFDDITPYTEYLPAEFTVSEVNNPFVFNAPSYARIGSGDIRGLSNYTTALSQGQFGQYPLVIFSTDGIWAASVSSEGYFAAVHPMSRDVCLDNSPIVQTDGAVFFASSKGLMVASGGKVECVSVQLNGKADKPFASFLDGALIAYDYRDSLLWIIRHDSNEAWLYNIKNGTFATKQLPGYPQQATITRIINKYPDSLIQLDNKVYTLLNRPNINSDNNRYSGTVVSRPMKLENALALKTIMQARHITDFSPASVSADSPAGSINLRIYASNNLHQWRELHSLRGTPWKYYRFQYSFTNLHATDRFAGTVLITQERRTNKLR